MLSNPTMFSDSENRIKQFVESSQLSIALYNSNPENVIIENAFSWPGILKVLSAWHHQQLKFIITGYMAAAHYGLVRASTSVEVIVDHQLKGCPSPFIQENVAESFNMYWQNSRVIELSDSSVRIISLTDLMEEFQGSDNEIKMEDAKLLEQINSQPLS